MGRKIGAGLLLFVAAFMLLGFLRSGATLLSPTALFALLLTVGLPAVAGISLLRGVLRGGSGSRLQALRQQTIDAEILKLAMARGGRLTEVEVVSALALPAAEAKASLEALVAREVADLDVSDEGVLLYTFHEAKYFDGPRDAGRLPHG